MKKQVAAIIPAAGFGTRMKVDRPKQYLQLGDTPILVRTVRSFIDDTDITCIIVVVPEEKVKETEVLFLAHKLDQPYLQIIAGGKRRQDSVEAGLQALPESVEIVLVHDGARPLVTAEIIERCKQGALLYGAAIAAVPVKDTLKQVGEDLLVKTTIDRSNLWQAQTPQAARKELLEKAYRVNNGADATDEASLLEKAAIPVKIVEGGETNLKITRPEDLALAENIIRKEPFTQIKPLVRIGHGYDAHRLAEDRKLVLGGVTVPHSQGLAGHSDADVVTHALCDALLGALGEGDIGKHFPDTDKTYAGIYSITLLERVIELVTDRGYFLSNSDITIVCQAPKLAPYLKEMQSILSKACKVDTAAFNIKATTTEKMGFTGRKEGIGCHAVVLLQQDIKI